MQRTNGDPLPWDAIVGFSLMAIPGVLVGTWLQHKVDPQRLTQVFVGLLVVVAVYTAISSGLALASG